MSSRKPRWILVVAIVAIVILVLGFLGSFELGLLLNNPVNDPGLPWIVVTNANSTFNSPAGCPSGYSSITFSAILVNSGSTGYAHVDYIVDNQAVDNNVYQVAAHSSLAINDTTPLSFCANRGAPYEIYIDDEWAAKI